MYAKDVMDARFHVLNPQQSIVDAIALFETAGQQEGKKIFGMMVIDDNDI